MSLTRKVLSVSVSVLALASAVVQAAPVLTITGGTTSSLSNIGFDPNWFGGSSAYSGFSLSNQQIGGVLSVDSYSNATFTYLGKEAAYNNAFLDFKVGSTPVGSFTTNGSAPGSFFSVAGVSAGALNFGFKSNLEPQLFGNGSNAVGVILSTNKQSALLLFNDKGGDRDYDDMVVKVSFTSAVPEPQTYAMLLAGLGLMGAVAMRRRKPKALAA